MGGDAGGLGGVVFRASGELYFLPASVAVKVVPVPEIARVPGAPAELEGVALVDGQIVPVVAASGARERIDQAGKAPEVRGAMLVCSYLGERLGLVGVEVVATGRFFEGEPPLVGDGRPAAAFDIGALVGRVCDARWVG